MTRILEFIRATVRGLSVFLLLMLILTPLAQIVMRGVFGFPMSGAEELARYFLICLSFLAASYVTRDGGQICMEELQAMLPDKLRWLTQMLIEFLGIVFFGSICIASIVTISRNLENQTATLEMPFYIFMAPLALGMFLLALETLMVLIHLVRTGRANDKATNLT